MKESLCRSSVVMRIRKLVFFAVASTVAVGLGSQSANGQALPKITSADLQFRPPLPLSNDPEYGPAPEWSVWGALYTFLESSSRNAIAPVETLLGERADLESYEANSVLTAGRDYLRQLAEIDQEARQEILTRFRPRNAPPPPPVPGGGGPREAIELPHGTTLSQILEAEGFIQRLEERKQALLTAHRAQLEQLIGPIKLKRLEVYVETEIAPTMKEVTSATLIRSERNPEALQ